MLGGAAVLCGLGAIRPAAAQSADERAVAQAVEALTRAMLEPDRGRLESLAADGLSCGHSSGRVETKAQFVATLAEKVTPFRSINLSDQTISIVGDEAIVRHRMTGETEDKGKVTPVNIGVLQVWTKEAGGWRLLARQAFRT